jgi:uncharacterized protein YwlG (UPF0340 family)
MTTTISPRRIKEGVARTAALCLLALAAVLLHSREARAQWTTSGNTTTTTNNVGIGTASPATGKLVIGGTAGQTGLDMSSADQYAEMRVIRNSLNAADKDLFLQWQAGAGSKIHFYSNNTETMTLNAGNVGIGTTTPSRLLELSASSTNTLPFMASAAALSIFNSNNTTANNTADLSFRTVDAAGAAITPAKVVAVFTNRTAGASAGDLAFVTLNASIGAERMRVTSTGDVGIGTTTPASKLHVAGNITVDGNINAKYQDVAEWVPTTQKLAAGTVVVLDIRHDNHVAASTAAYDTRVAGVVSAQPGLTLGEAGEDKALVATTGRVKVKVDASRAAIQIGDLIVTSDVEGVAMKSVPVDLGGTQIHRPGTIIGKALEALDKGTGEILVLLSLQ